MSSGSMPDSETNMRSNPHDGSPSGAPLSVYSSIKGTTRPADRLPPRRGPRRRPNLSVGDRIALCDEGVSATAPPSRLEIQATSAAATGFILGPRRLSVKAGAPLADRSKAARIGAEVGPRQRAASASVRWDDLRGRRRGVHR